MNISTNSTLARHSLRPETQELLKRILSPMAGIASSVGFMLPGRHEPHVLVAGAELTGIHRLLGQETTPSYHVGGGGVFVDEPIIRALAESLERYASFLGTSLLRAKCAWASVDELGLGRIPVIADGALTPFLDEQLARPDFPFKAPRRNTPLSWVKVCSPLDGTTAWAPAQSVLVGYTPRADKGEPWFTPAVTTGTAAHTERDRARRNALRELIQIDAAMGHWYGAQPSSRIVLDDRLAAFSRLVSRHFRSSAYEVEFYSLSSPDLPGFVAAAKLRAGNGRLPRHVVGLGADGRLSRALYAALIEASGVLQLAKVGLLMGANAATSGVSGDSRGSEVPQVMDLDANVAYYASSAKGARHLEEKFDSRRTVEAVALPPDAIFESASSEVGHLLAAFRSAGHRLFELDISTEDVRELGFHVARFWSPDLLAVCLPSAPPLRHPRFEVFGSDPNAGPHPYP